MGLVITPQNQINAYYESTALSQSSLKELQHGLDKFLAAMQRREEIDDSNKNHFLFGSAVDIILTGNEEEFDSLYFVSSLDKKPSEVEMNITQFIFDRIVTEISTDMEEIGNLEEYPGIIKAAVEFYGWQPKWKEDTKIEKIIKACSLYFEDLKISFGKKILSNSQYEDIKAVVKSLRENPRTKHYFDRETLNADNNIVVYYQLPLFFKVKDIDCKALLDMLVVVKNEHGIVTALCPIDLKTKNSYTIDFPSSVKSFRYDIQAAWYTDALLNETTIFPEGFPELPGNREDLIKPFTFIVESSTNPGKPLIFKVTDNILDVGRNGRRNPETGKIYHKGYHQLVNEYKYYSETGWVEESFITECNGVLSLDWDGIVEDNYG